MEPQTGSPSGGAGSSQATDSSPSHRSIWSRAPDEFIFAPLTADLEVDVVIIGAGITGITTAALLSRAGKNVAVLEAARVGHGDTGFSTGNLYAPVDMHLYKMFEKWGWDRTRQVVHSRRMAIDLIERHVTDYRIDCGFSRQPWVLYSATASPETDDIVEREYEASSECGLDARLTNNLMLPFSFHRALVVAHQAQFHPLAYVRQLAAAIRSDDCRIFEDSPVIEIEQRHGIVRTAQHRVRAQAIVMATHTPKGFNLLQTELGPYREYAVGGLLAEKQLSGGIFWSAGPGRTSTRLVEYDGKPYVLMIGEKHKVGQRDDPGEGYRKLEQLLRARFSVQSMEYRWSAQQYRPADGLPYIGPAIGSSRLYVATGFASDGLVYGTLSAMILVEQLSGGTTVYDDLYSPRRFTPVKSAGKFMKENLNVASYYVKDYIKGATATRLADVPRGEGKVVEVEGEKVAVYRDDAGELHAVSPVCTHLKCIVHWNRAERSWDCPCHGSRFSCDGEVLEGPALTPLARRSVAGVRDKEGTKARRSFPA